MDNLECSWCGAELGADAVPHKGLVFCSEDCREEWEQDLEETESFDLDEIEGEMDGDDFGDDEGMLAEYDDDL